MGWFKSFKQAHEDEKEYQRLKAEARSANASRAGSVASRTSSVANTPRRSSAVSQESSRQQSNPTQFRRWSEASSTSTSPRPSVTRRHRDHSRSTGTQTPRTQSQRNESRDDSRQKASRDEGTNTANTSGNRPPLSPRTQPVSLRMSENSFRSPRQSGNSPPFSHSDSPVRRSPMNSHPHSSYTTISTSPQHASLLHSNTQVPRSQRERIVSFEPLEDDEDIPPYSHLDTGRAQLASSTNTQPPVAAERLVFISTGSCSVRHPTTRPRPSGRPHSHVRDAMEAEQRAEQQRAESRSIIPSDASDGRREVEKTETGTQTAGCYLPYGPPRNRQDSGAPAGDSANVSTSSLAPSRQKLHRPIVAPLYSYLGTSGRASVTSRPWKQSLSKPPQSPPRRSINRSYVDPHAFDEEESYVELVGVLRQHESGSPSRGHSPYNDESAHIEAQDLLSGLWESAADYNGVNGASPSNRLQPRSPGVPARYVKGVPERRNTTPLQLRRQREEWEGPAKPSSVTPQETPVRSPFPTDWTASTVRADQLPEDGNSPWPRWTSPSQQQQPNDLVRSPTQHNPYGRTYGNGYAAPYAPNAPYA